MGRRASPAAEIRMHTPIRTLLVGVATWKEEDPALAFAIQLAEQLDATLHVVHAFVPPQVVAGEWVPPLDPAYLSDYRQDVQDQLEAHVRESATGVRVVCRAVPGVGYSAVGEVAKEVGADLLVVGATRHGRVGRLFLGTTAGRVIRDAQAPVLVVRQPPEHAIRRVLLTTDLSESSARAYDTGIRVLRELFRAEPRELRPGLFHYANRELRCLRVVWDGPPDLPPLSDDRVHHAHEAELRQFLSERDPAGLEVTPRLRTGNPSEEILAEAEEWPADLIVLGTHGSTGLSRFLLGSVAEAVLRDTPCNALVIPVAATDQTAQPPRS
jgi:nucleotide-binding universal stress UspA family protein